MANSYFFSISWVSPGCHDGLCATRAVLFLHLLTVARLAGRAGGPAGGGRAKARLSRELNWHAATKRALVSGDGRFKSSLTSDRDDKYHCWNGLEGGMVAGAGFEPATFGL